MITKGHVVQLMLLVCLAGSILLSYIIFESTYEETLIIIMDSFSFWIDFQDSNSELYAQLISEKGNLFFNSAGAALINIFTYIALLITTILNILLIAVIRVDSEDLGLDEPLL